MIVKRGKTERRGLVVGCAVERRADECEPGSVYLSASEYGMVSFLFDFSKPSNFRLK